MPPHDDQRLKIRLKFPDREKFARLYERELSKGGIFLKSPQLKPIGTEVEIHFLPRGTEVGIRLIGQIIHVVTSGDAELTGGAPGMGVRFFDLDVDPVHIGLDLQPNRFRYRFIGRIHRQLKE